MLLVELGSHGLRSLLAWGDDLLCGETFPATAHEYYDGEGCKSMYRPQDGVERTLEMEGWGNSMGEWGQE